MKKILCSIFLIFLLVAQGYSLTRAEIRGEIRKTLNDIPAISYQQRWTNNILNKRINLAQRDISAKTKCIRSTYTFTTVAGQREYDLPNNIIANQIERVAYWISGSTNAWKKLGWRSIRGLDEETSNWEYPSSGLPIKYYERGKKIGLVPTVSVLYSTANAVYVDYYSYTDDMNNDDDIPFNSLTYLYTYHDLIIYYVIIWCLNDQEKNATYFEAKYNAGLQELSEDMKNRPDRTGQLQIRVK